MTNVVKKVRQVAGVDKIRIKDFRKGIFAITPSSTKAPSPRAIWDAVVKAGFTPTRLATPSANHTKRPPD